MSRLTEWCAPTSSRRAALRESRELTRYRKTQVDARVKEIQRLEKLLQDAGIKLASVASRTGRSRLWPWSRR